ncbi:MAG: hypothetical protein ACE15C_01780 [Phycisphaerae bacterium]
MSVSFVCANPACGRAIKAPDSAAGKKGSCPFCKLVQTIPAVEPAKAADSATAGVASPRESKESSSAAPAGQAKFTLGKSYRPYTAADAGRQRTLPTNRSLGPGK